MSQPTYSVPDSNSPTSTEEPKIIAALAELKTLLTANLATDNLHPNAGITGGQLAAAAGIVGGQLLDGTVADTDLASPNNAVYKTLLVARGGLGSDTTAGTYHLTAGGNDKHAVAVPVASLAASIPQVIYFDDADYTVSSKTQKLRVRAQILTNATQPTITFTFGLYPVTVAGGADQITFTLGTVVPGSTVAFASPAASTASQNNSGDFTIPADGVYALGLVTSGTLTNNAVVIPSAQLQSRHV